MLVLKDIHDRHKNDGDRFCVIGVGCRLVMILLFCFFFLSLLLMPLLEHPWRTMTAILLGDFLVCLPVSVAWWLALWGLRADENCSCCLCSSCSLQLHVLWLGPFSLVVIVMIWISILFASFLWLLLTVTVVVVVVIVIGTKEILISWFVNHFENGQTTDLLCMDEHPPANPLQVGMSRCKC